MSHSSVSEELLRLRADNQHLQQEVARLQAPQIDRDDRTHHLSHFQAEQLLDLAHVLIRDKDSRIIFWNRGAEALYGWTEAEALGQVSHSLLQTVFPQSLAAIEEALSNDGEWEGELVHTCRDGSRSIVASHQVLYRDNTGGPTAILEVNNDISRLKRAEQDLQDLQQQNAERLTVLEAANHVALDILTSQNGTDALKHIAEAARKLTGAGYAAVGVACADGNGLQEFVTVGLTPEQEAQIGSRPQGQGLLGLLLQRANPLRVEKLAEHPVASGFPANHPPMDSFLGVPIRRGDAVLGSLYLTNKVNGGPFTPADEVAVQSLGAHAAVAIHNWHLLSRQRALLRGIIIGQEEERRSVAYDLHDGLTQYVMASHAHIQTAWRARQTEDGARAEREMQVGLGYLHHAVVESRRLVNGLRSLTLDEMGLAGALEQLLREEKQRSGWTETEFIHNVDQIRFDIALETTAFRVAQEALNNARKHAGTTRLQLILLLQVKPDTGKKR